MQFQIKCVKDFLLKNGFVFTVRSYNYNTNHFVFNKILFRRYLIKNINWNENLTPFCFGSGFKTIDDWWEKILKFYVSKKIIYLYLVVIDYDMQKMQTL